jgi:hypothetical protein
MTRTVFEQARATAIADLAKLLMQVQDRVGLPTAIPLLGYGMRMIDEAETAQNLKEWEGHLTKLHEFFQTNLNNHFPSHDSMKRFFRDKGIDMGIDYPIYGIYND